MALLCCALAELLLGIRIYCGVVSGHTFTIVCSSDD